MKLSLESTASAVQNPRAAATDETEIQTSISYSSSIIPPICARFPTLSLRSSETAFLKESSPEPTVSSSRTNASGNAFLNSPISSVTGQPSAGSDDSSLSVRTITDDTAAIPSSTFCHEGTPSTICLARHSSMSASAPALPDEGRKPI